MSADLQDAEVRAGLSRFEPLLNAAAVAIMASFFLLWDVSRAIFVLLSLAALLVVIRYRPRMPADHRLFSWPIFAFVGANFLSLAADGFGDRGVNQLVSRYLLLLIAVPLASLFYLSFDARRNPWIKYAAGCVVIGGLAIVDNLYFDEFRAGAGHNPAVFGFIALAMTSVVAASYHRFRQTRPGLVIFMLSISMGLCAMILSGTRTSWLAGFVVLVCVLFFYFDRYSWTRRLLIAFAVIAGISLASSSLPLVQKRIDVMIDMVTPYVKGEQQSEFTSLSYRVELWKLGWRMGMDHVIVGFGPGNTKNSIREYAANNPQFEGLENMNHIHNQFLQSFAMSGIVGLISLLALLGCHFWLFTKYLGKAYSREVRALALAGFLLMIAYAIKSLPGVPFYGKQYLMMYGFASATLWGCLLGALRSSAQAGQKSDPGP